MLLRSHGPDNRPEGHEVLVLHDKRMALEEREDPSLEIDHAVDREDIHPAPDALATDTSAVEERLERFEHRSVPLVLRHLEDRVDLPSRCAPHQWVLVDRNGKAT